MSLPFLEFYYLWRHTECTFLVWLLSLIWIILRSIHVVAWAKDLFGEVSHCVNRSQGDTVFIHLSVLQQLICFQVRALWIELHLCTCLYMVHARGFRAQIPTHGMNKVHGIFRPWSGRRLSDNSCVLASCHILTSRWRELLLFRVCTVF